MRYDPDLSSGPRGRPERSEWFIDDEPMDWPEYERPMVELRCSVAAGLLCVAILLVWLCSIAYWAWT